MTGYGPYYPTMAELQINANESEGIVEVNTGNGWRGMTPEDARQLADTYEKGVEDGEMDDDAGTRRFISLLRSKADEVSQ